MDHVFLWIRDSPSQRIHLQAPDSQGGVSVARAPSHRVCGSLPLQILQIIELRGCEYRGRPLVRHMPADSRIVLGTLDCHMAPVVPQALGNIRQMARSNPQPPKNTTFFVDKSMGGKLPGAGGPKTKSDPNIPNRGCKNIGPPPPPRPQAKTITGMDAHRPRSNAVQMSARKALMSMPLAKAARSPMQPGDVSQNDEGVANTVSPFGSVDTGTVDMRNGRASAAVAGNNAGLAGATG